MRKIKYLLLILFFAVFINLNTTNVISHSNISHTSNTQINNETNLVAHFSLNSGFEDKVNYLEFDISYDVNNLNIDNYLSTTEGLSVDSSTPGIIHVVYDNNIYLNNDSFLDITFTKNSNYESNINVSNFKIKNELNEVIVDSKEYVKIDLDENKVNEEKTVNEENLTVQNNNVETMNTIEENSNVAYKSHVSGIGWQDYKQNGETSGTTGQSRQMEAIQIKIEEQNSIGNIMYKTHISGFGWESDWKLNDIISGTTGQSRSIEAIAIKLTDEMERKYDIYYRVHSANIGWLDWAKNGEYAGTTGYGYAIEAIEIKLVKKGEAAPGNTDNPFLDKLSVKYNAHVSGIGWEGYKANGDLSGTTGQSRQMEAIQIKLDDQNYNGNIMYKTHISGIGWENEWKTNNNISGTTGQCRSIEAIGIKLTDEMAEKYDIYYRVHSSNIGWLGWTKNGDYAGTVGYGYGIEAIEIKLIKKRDKAPENTNNSFLERLSVKYKSYVSDIGWQDYKQNGETSGITKHSNQMEAIQIKLDGQNYAGNIMYKTHISGIGWEGDWKLNDNISGTTGQSRSVEAIAIKLTDEMAEKYDIYYRVYSPNFGWLDWAKNGGYAGTIGYGYGLSAIEILLVKSGNDAPGSIENSFFEKIDDIDNIPDNSSILYKTHVSGIGWQDYKQNGEMSGTTGESRNVEAIQIKSEGQRYTGNIMYKTHISGIGWENDWKSNDNISGTTGQSRSIEAIAIKLTDEMERKYDIYYRVHSSNFGWLDWAKNGGYAGTVGYGYAMEAIEIRLVRKGEAAPGDTEIPFVIYDDGYYMIVSKLNENKVLDIRFASKLDGTNVQLHDINNTNGQVWYLKRADARYYYIMSALNHNLCLDVQGAGTSNGTNIEIYRANGNDNQLWKIVKDDNGFVSIISKLNGFCLDVLGFSTANETNIVLYQQTNADNQKFKLVRYNNSLIYNGLDISAHNGNIDFNALKESANFVIIRAGYGNDEWQQDDSRYIEYINNCEAYNIPYGIYIYSYALNTEDAVSEASHALRLLQHTGSNFQLGVWFDMEDADGYKARHGMFDRDANGAYINGDPRQRLSDICYVFSSVVESHGYNAGIYASISWFDGYLNDSRLNSFDKWIAHWNGPVTFDSARSKGTYNASNCKIWQFCSDGSISGVNGNVDLDLGFNLFI